MTPRLHHIFVCASVDAPEADALLDAGLLEGSANTHLGQGTANRRFFFEKGFLELLWVHDEREARSPVVASSMLWDRWVERGKAASRFGICFSSSDGVSSDLPFSSWKYQPPYLSADRYILFADKLPLSEPAVFVLSWPQAQTSPRSEPTQHSLGLREMQSVSVGVPDPDSISDALCRIRDGGLVRVHRSVEAELVIKFASQEDVEHRVSSLGLSLVGRHAA